MVAYSFKPRFVDAIRAGLSSVSLSFDPMPKRQTIRAVGRRRHARPGDRLQLYCGQRTRRCFKIGDAICLGVGEIKLYVNAGKIIAGGAAVKDLDGFARDDGFADWADMREFWRAEHAGVTDLFIGLLIMWERMP